MDRSHTIFGNKLPPIAPKNHTGQQQEKRPRKRRSDAKNDIKFKLSAEDKKLLRERARDHKLSLTMFASMVVISELERTTDFSHFEYDQNGKFVHVTLEDQFFERIKDLSIEWDLPYRHVAHRIIKNYMWHISGGFQIIDFREGSK